MLYQWLTQRLGVEELDQRPGLVAHAGAWIAVDQ
jgi:hypothetical protein